MPSTRHTETIADIRAELIATGKRLYDRHLLVATDGNISYRIDDSCILITGTGSEKGILTDADIACVDIDGNVISGQPSSELAMHLTVYQQCAQAKAAVHAHPAAAIAWTITEEQYTELPADCLSEVLFMAGKIPILPYARPGTKAMGEVLIPHLPERNSLILAHHGAITWGTSLNDAFGVMERLEHAASILIKAKNIGNIKALPQVEIDYLTAAGEQARRKGDS